MLGFVFFWLGVAVAALGGVSALCWDRRVGPGPNEAWEFLSFFFKSTFFSQWGLSMIIEGMHKWTRLAETCVQDTNNGIHRSVCVCACV